MYDAQCRNQREPYPNHYLRESVGHDYVTGSDDVGGVVFPADDDPSVTERADSLPIRRSWVFEEVHMPTPMKEYEIRQGGG